MTNTRDTFQKEAIEYSPWNPFTPTETDIKRTEILAKKSYSWAVFLCFLAPVFCMSYLNRGVNNLKMIGYGALVGGMIGFTSSNIENSESRNKYYNEMIGIVQISLSISLMTENVRSITLARKRLASQKQTQNEY